MAIDEWVTVALTDDALVVELLFRLKKSSESFALLPLMNPHPLMMVPPVGWGHRKPRSRPLPPPPTQTRKESETTTRCSPTTPLSWSGGSGSGSPSDGNDESSRPSDSFIGGRSKGTFTNETSTTNANKRSRKKKTFSELREDETLLLKERVHLKKELASLRVSLKEQKARKENLKRIKLDTHLQLANKRASTSDEPEDQNSSQPNLIEPSMFDRVSVLSTEPTQDSSEVKERCFLPFDLNMTPSEEESVSETLCGMS